MVGLRSVRSSMVSALIVCLWFCNYASADTVILDNGESLQGTVQSKNADIVVIKTEKGTEEINRSFIRKIVINEDSPAVTSPAEQQQTTTNVEAVPDVESSSFHENIEANKISINNTSSQNAMEYVIKISPNLFGKHELSNGRMSLSGYGEANNINTSQDVDTGLSVSGELSRYVNDNFGLGGGVSLQLSRKLSDADGEFNFIPFYGIAKLRTSPDGSGNYKYVLGQLGYNSFSGDSNYKGQGGKLTGGLYWGMGAGFVFKMIHVEALYSVNNGKYEQSTYVYDSDYYVYRYFSASGDVKYSSISLNIGVHF